MGIERQIGAAPTGDDDPAALKPLALNEFARGVAGQESLSHVLGAGNPEDQIPIGAGQYRALDARGGEGIVTARFFALGPVSPELAACIGLFNVDGRIGEVERGPRLKVLEDYSGWTDHAAIRVLVFGLESLVPLESLPAGACVRTYRSLNEGPALNLLVLHEIVLLAGQHAMITVEIEHRIGTDGHFHTRCVAKGLPPDTLEIPPPLRRAARTVTGIRVAPGPKPGSVKAAKYKAKKPWHAAIREQVLSKRTAQTADDDTIAYWLDISRAQLFVLMKRWGPRKMADLRAGRF